MRVRKILMLACGLLVFSILISSPRYDSFAVDGAKVRAARRIFIKCKVGKKFATFEDIFVKAQKLFRDKAVDVYITQNKIWRFGTIIDTVVTAEFDLTTDKKGKLKCDLIWQATTTAGNYDIVVDVNQDGTYNQGDAVFNRTFKPGLKILDIP